MSAPARIRVAQIVTRCTAGAGGVAVRGALGLDPSRYDITIVTGEGGLLLDRASEAGINVVLEPSLVSPISPKNDKVALQRLTQLCFAAGFEVVHTHSAKAGALGRIAAHRAGVPVIVHTYHGFPFNEFQNPATRAAYVAIERRLSRITDVVLAIGGGVATEALRRGLARPTALRTIAPAVESITIPRTATTRRAARSRLGLPLSVPVLGTVGRVDYQKAPEHFAEAFAALRHKEAIAVWVGSGTQLEEMRQFARARGLAERLRFIGEREDVAELLPAFDVFAMSSRYEGLPCAVVEALRCGLPVVATAVNSVPDLVIPGETGILVPAGQPKSLASAVDLLLDRPDLAQQLADRGQQAAGAPYDAQRLGQALDEVYSGGLQSNLLRMAS